MRSVRQLRLALQITKVLIHKSQRYLKVRHSCLDLPTTQRCSDEHWLRIDTPMHMAQAGEPYLLYLAAKSGRVEQLQVCSLHQLTRCKRTLASQRLLCRNLFTSASGFCRRLHRKSAAACKLIDHHERQCNYLGTAPGQPAPCDIARRLSEA